MRLSLEENLTPDPSASPDLPEAVKQLHSKLHVRQSRSIGYDVTDAKNTFAMKSPPTNSNVAKTQEVTVLQSHGVYFHNSQQHFSKTNNTSMYDKRDYVPPWHSIPNSEH